MEFTLPPLSQQSFSRWYNKKVPRQDNINERIVYPGMKLQCSTKSRDLRSEITAAHVFITHIPETNTFFHKVLGNNNIFAPLPKRLYSHCFHNINIHSIPQNNRITVRLTENTSVVLPFIPDDFVAQKRSKRGSLTHRRTRGNVKKMKVEAETTAPDVSTAPYTGWVTHIMSNNTDTFADNGIDAFRIMLYIRKQLSDNEQNLNATLPNPFDNTNTIAEIEANPDKQQALSTIIQFLHHYGRHFFLQ
tara:strand:+ start:2825 stop:3565 length:741 start_codon:yes stop_codon:yes gene_type:complete